MENLLEARPRNRKKTNPEPLCCPVCSCTLRANEFDSHYSLEIERLQKLSANCGRTRKSGSNNPSPEMPSSSNGRNATTRSTSGETSTTPTGGGEKCWGTYQKIKNNRQARLKLKTRKRKIEENVCPVCNQRTTEDLTLHVEMCLRKSEANGGAIAMSDDESIDVEGDMYEEYEWAGQTRIRSCSLLPGGNYSAALASTSATKVTNAGESDDELNVDGDEPQIYGPAQYFERDIIANDDSSYLRELVAGPVTTATASVRQCDSVVDVGEGTSSLNGQHENNQNLLNDSSPEASPKQSDAANQVIESLKAKIREYERYFQNKPKCLICLDDYKNPVVSICCWHVACEVCFLNQLGAKKLCPQCNMITSATDLRRIYL